MYDITVHKIYAYPRPETGGHTEYVRIHGNGTNESVMEGLRRRPTYYNI